MFKNLLVASLALLTVSSAHAFGHKTPKIESNRFSAYPGVVEKSNQLKTRAESALGSMDFTLADEVYTAIKLNNVKVGDELYTAFEMSKENTQIFADDEITSVNITTGAQQMGQSVVNAITDVTIFITEDLDKEPVYTQSGTLGKAGFTEYKVPLNTPYKIQAGKSFFIGYSFKVPNSSQYYLAVDGIATNSSEVGWVGKNDDGVVKWDNIATQVGAICMGCTLRGNNFPSDNIALDDYYGPTYVEPGEQFEYLFLLKNKGFTASNVEIEYTVAGSAPQTITTNLVNNPNDRLPITIGYNEYGLAVLPLVCNEEAMAVPLTFKITKVDGAPNKSEQNAFVSSVDCFARSKGFDRVHVIEEGTGTWCGFCPRGIVMMDYVSEKYPDMFALVAIHASQGASIDRMQVASTSEVRRALFNSYPSAYIDRTYMLSNMTDEEIDQYVNAFKDIPSAMGITELTATMLDNGYLKADTKVKSCFDFENNNRYRLAYYLTQNNVGPYTQTNYYAGGGEGPMSGWEKKGSKVSTMYDDVCRLLVGGIRGLTESLPAEIKGGEEVGYVAEMTTEAVNASEFYLTAFIVDSATFEIVNAKQIKVEKDYSGVEDIMENATPVSKKYYNISGAEVKNPSNGIYIVRTSYSDGTVKTTKEAFK